MTACQDCSSLSGVTCTLGLVQAKTDYWLYVQDNGFVLTAPCSKQRCKGSELLKLTSAAAAGTIQQCTEPRPNNKDNRLCGGCPEGYQDIDGMCSPCEKSSPRYIILGVILGFILVIVLYVLESKRPASGDTSIVVYYAQVALLIAGPTAAWSKWMSFIALSTNPTQYGSDCAIKQDDVIQNLFMPFFTFLMLYAFGIVFSVTHFLLSRFPVKRFGFLAKLENSFNIESHIRTAIAIAMFSYSGITLAAFSSLSCVSVAGKNVLYHYPGIDCDSSGYKTGFALQIVLIIFFVFGLPATILAGLSVAKDKILSSDFLRVAFGNLIEPYRPGALFYQSWVLLRRSMYTAIQVGVSLHVELRAMSLSLLSLACLTIHVWIRPFNSNALNLVEAISLSLHLILAIIISPWQLPYPLSMEAIITCFIVLPTLGFVGWRAAGMIGRMLKKKSTVQPTENGDVEMAQAEAGQEVGEARFTIKEAAPAPSLDQEVQKPEQQPSQDQVVFAPPVDPSSTNASFAAADADNASSRRPEDEAAEAKAQETMNPSQAARVPLPGAVTGSALSARL